MAPTPGTSVTQHSRGGMCISVCSVGTVLSLFLGRVSLSLSIISITPELAKKLRLCVPFAPMIFLIAQRDVYVCVCEFMHPCICVKTAQADNAWPDLKVTSLTCLANCASEEIRFTVIFFCVKSGGFDEDHGVLDEDSGLSIYRCDLF